jgi:uncharacterized repeat protein (TIGR03943 family)
MKIARTIVLAVWACFLAYLWVSGEMARFLGPRTYWVVGFGAVTLALAAAAQVVSLKSESRRASARPRDESSIGVRGSFKPSVGDLLGLATLLVPLVALLAIPQPDLGALAASRKSTGSLGAGFVAPPSPEAGAELSFIDIHFANASEEYAANLRIADGTEMELTGFVSEGSNSTGTFLLTRFYVSCCAADAIPYSIAVDPSSAGADYPANDWLRVRGSLEETGSGWQLVAEDIVEVQEPETPYLY